MRKLFAAVCIFIALCSSVALAAPAAKYTIPELYMTVEIPEGWAVFTRDVKTDDPNLGLVGMDAESFKKVLEENDAYLDALKTEPISEITIVKQENDEDTRDVFDMKRLSDSEIKEWIEKDPEKAEQMGITMNGYSIYNHKQAKFVSVDVQFEANGMIAYGKWYFTIINGQGISITLKNYTGKVTAEQKQVLKDVVDSVVFTEVKEKPFNIDWGKIAIGGAVGGSVGAVAWLIVNVIKKKKKVQNTGEKE
ncbi:MAG: hypothetical protein ACOYU3_08615 [Bacillota bacterium]